MPNKENLILLKKSADCSPEEREQQNAIRSKGAKAKAEIHNKQQTIKEVAQMVLKMPVSMDIARKYCGNYIDGLTENNLTLEKLASISLMREVVENGNAKAYEVLRDTAGFSPKVDLNINGNLDVLTASDRAILTKMREKLPTIVQSADDSET